MNRIGSLFQSNNANRVTGLTGFDTESTVARLMEAEQMPLTKLQQQRQLIEWRQESFRDISASLRGFKSTFFDVLNPSTHILSENSIRSLSARSSSDSFVSATASADADIGTNTVIVGRLATADAAVSTSPVTALLRGQTTPSSFSLQGMSLTINLDGDSRAIALGNYADLGQLSAGLQQSIDTAFGAGRIVLGLEGDRLTINTVAGSGSNQITLTNTSATDQGLSSLGFSSGATNRLSRSQSLGSLANQFATPLIFDSGNVNFSINGRSFTFSSTTSLRDVISAINADGVAQVRISYDEASDSFSIRSNRLGAGDNIRLSETGSNFFSALGIDSSAAQAGWVQGQNSLSTVNGQTVSRNSNTFALNGVTYTLNQAHPANATGETVTVSQNVDSAVDRIRSFVERYNSLLDSLNTQVTDRRDRDFAPLTEAQREAMSEEDAAAWDVQAKRGLLHGDRQLSNIIRELRNAITDAVEGSGLTLREVGISSRTHTDRGRLTIDEGTLREALQNRPQQVASLLNGASIDVPFYSRTLTLQERETRYRQSGVFQRISDVVDNHISPLRDATGRKGTLLERAGIVGDLSANRNMIERELESFDDRISDMLERLERKEEMYFRQFSAMESAMQRLSQQSAWLTNQLGGE